MTNMDVNKIIEENGATVLVFKPYAIVLTTPIDSEYDIEALSRQAKVLLPGVKIIVLPPGVQAIPLFAEVAGKME